MTRLVVHRNGRLAGSGSSGGGGGDSGSQLRTVSSDPR